MDDAAKLALLNKHNPILVLLPPADGTTRRPGAWWRWPARRGDYYPCSVEVFLDLVAQRDTPRKWKLLHWHPDAPWMIFKAPPSLPTGFDNLRKLTVAASPSETEKWELDIAPLRSQAPSASWDAYQALCLTRPEAKQPVTYGRCVEKDGRVFLQYWYLYLYNDAGNTHEGDWEMVSLELDASSMPVQAGYSGHQGGHRRAWDDVARWPDEAPPPQAGSPEKNRPLVYVARGSHAAYFKPCKVKTLKIAWPKSVKDAPKTWLVNAIAAVDGVISLVPPLGIWDRTAKLESDMGSGFETGALVYPRVELMPEEPPEAGKTHGWWRKLNCAWGSSHTRISDFIGPPPPWKQNPKWDDPGGWINGLEPDET